MSTITALRTGKTAAQRVNLFLDGKFAFALEKEEAAQEGLKVGLELTGDRLEALIAALRFNRCLNTAYRYLSYRPRSEAELREKLQRRGFPREHIITVIGRLKEQGLLDDTTFAQFWVENRTIFRPRSRGLTRLELRRKGVAEDAIRQAVGEIDEAEAAYRAACTKARRLSRLDYTEFRQRLGEFLRRRGFTYDTIDQAIKRAWEEREKEN